MQILTAQYTQFITHKFKIDYTDFNTIAAATGSLKLADIESRSFVLFSQVVQTIRWVGTGLTAINLNIMPSWTVGEVPTDKNRLVGLSVFSANQTWRGGFEAAKRMTQTANNATFILNYTSADAIYAQVDVNAGGLLTALTAGEAIIYYSIARLK